MAWDLLPVDYTDAAWVGLKRYNQIDNEDGTISLQDVTVYSNKEKSFFGAKDANRMNEALNTLMSMVENGTDLADVRGSNPNLLHNWYFADPIDQRQGYIVPPDTPYYSDTALSTQVGTVSEYTTAVKVDDTYGTITVSGTTYYIAWSAAVRGYMNIDTSTYAIDRWKNFNSTLTINSGYINWKSSKEPLYKRFRQLLDFPLKANMTYTLSILAKINDISGGIRLRPTQGPGTLPGASGKILSSVTDKYEIFSYTLIPKTDADTPSVEILCNNKETDYIDIDIIGWKLELGEHQTLAHQDADGNWVLNDPPPDKNMELLKCCMSTADSSDTYANKKIYHEGYKPTADDVGAITLLTGTAIPENADLNGYTTTGNYYCLKSVTAQKLSNCPIEKAFVMRVYYANGNKSYIGQELIKYDDGTRYYRMYDKGISTWTNWNSTYTTANKPTSADICAEVLNVTASKTLALTDSGKMLCVDSESDAVITIPANASVAFPVGAELEICQLGSGAVTFAAAEGVTLLSAGGAVMIAEQYGCATLKKLAANKWLLAGMLG